MPDPRPPLRRVGVAWRSRPGLTAIASGNVVINGLKQTFVVLRNSRKLKDTDPDFVLLSSDEPTVDPYGRDREHPAKQPAVLSEENGW